MSAEKPPRDFYVGEAIYNLSVFVDHDKYVAKMEDRTISRRAMAQADDPVDALEQCVAEFTQRYAGDIRAGLDLFGRRERRDAGAGERNN
jgi:hypothetical protein